MEKKELAASFFEEGYNCAQSVVLAFSEEIKQVNGLEKEALAALSSSFGGGMGRLREVCGAVTGMFVVAGFLCGVAVPDDDEEKGRHYQLIQDMAREFKAKNDSIICRELLGLTEEARKAESHVPSKRTESYYASRPCVGFVADAAEIVEKFTAARLAEMHLLKEEESVR